MMAAGTTPRGPDPGWDWLPGARVPFDWGSFLHKTKILFRDHGGLKAVAGPLAGRTALFLVGQAAWALDERRSPDWREASLRGPLFILGHQRSGTTFLHRLLSRDRDHARALHLHEMLLPASSLQVALRRVAEWDRRTNGRLQKRFQQLQEWLFGALDPIHRVRFDEVEEDEFVLWTIFSSAMCVNDAPISTANEKLDGLRNFDQWSHDRKVKTLGWYRACLLKKVHREPCLTDRGPAWVVSKNPAFTQKIPELLRTFPDAMLIYLIRNPLEAIPSRLSLIRAIWNHRFKGVDRMTPEQAEVIVEDSLRTYLYAERDLPGLPPERVLTVRYEELLQDPGKVVKTIYRHFQLPGPDGALGRELEKLEGRGKGHVSQHAYSLPEFHIDEHLLAEKLAPVLDRYAFPRPE